MLKYWFMAQLKAEVMLHVYFIHKDDEWTIVPWKFSYYK